MSSLLAENCRANIHKVSNCNFSYFFGTQWGRVTFLIDVVLLSVYPLVGFLSLPALSVHRQYVFFALFATKGFVLAVYVSIEKVPFTFYVPVTRGRE